MIMIMIVVLYIDRSIMIMMDKKFLKNKKKMINLSIRSIHTSIKLQARYIDNGGKNNQFTEQ